MMHLFYRYECKQLNYLIHQRRDFIAVLTPPFLRRFFPSTMAPLLSFLGFHLSFLQRAKGIQQQVNGEYIFELHTFRRDILQCFLPYIPFQKEDKQRLLLFVLSFLFQGIIYIPILLSRTFSNTRIYPSRYLLSIVQRCEAFI